ncbi:MAG: response regulator [Balneolaceae bacterium]|nr:MAG: response regulator [Balneolaceae bacterium]
MKKKVVIVEDDRLLALVLRKMAQSMNLNVVDIAHGGEDAIDSVNTHQPDLILMDILLADSTTGIEAMKRIREHSNVPVIYISAQTDDQLKKDAISVPNSIFLMKPVLMNELKSAVSGVQFAA